MPLVENFRQFWVDKAYKLWDDQSMFNQYKAKEGEGKEYHLIDIEAFKDAMRAVHVRDMTIESQGEQLAAKAHTIYEKNKEIAELKIKLAKMKELSSSSEG